MVNIGYKGIRTERFKYIQYTDLKGMDEFYDLEEDPYELANSIGNEQYASENDLLINELQAQIKHFEL